MNTVFADTFYFIALLNPADKDHDRALEFTRGFNGQIHTTGWVLTELADGLSRPPFRERVGSFIERLHRQPGVTVIPHGTELFDAGFSLFRKRADKEWSLTDCISFEAMQRAGIAEALTGDHHFEQAGFVALQR